VPRNRSKEGESSRVTTREDYISDLCSASHRLHEGLEADGARSSATARDRVMEVL
jgi:hypothetical protein